MNKKVIIEQGKEFLKSRNFRAAEDAFQSLIKAGENEPEILELKGDSLVGQMRIDYAQKCYCDAIEMVMIKIYDSIKSSEINDSLKINYEQLLNKLDVLDVRLYPKYSDLISKIQEGEHPRLSSNLKHKLTNPKFKLNYCGNYYTKKRDPEKYQTDQLTIEIIANKSTDSSEFISSKMLEYIQNNNINIDIIIPTPNHKSKICKGVSIALSLAKKLKKPCVLDALEKIEESNKNRKSYGPDGRKKLAKEQHKILDSSKIINKNILLVDDVLVSGSTVTACAKLLMDNGARHVDILCAGKSVQSTFS